MQIKLSRLLLVFIITGAALDADIVAQLPIKKVSLFSSGVGYFERSGELQGSVKLLLPFETAAINDALKSLIVYDPASDAPLVSYASEDLQKTLSELKINLSGNPSITQILHSLKGAELEIYAPDKIVGKIIGTQVNREKNYDELSLLVNNNIHVVPLNNVTSYKFTDAKISQDLTLALDTILNHRQNVKNLYLYLPSSKKRNVSISYVIPAPVWKSTYRLDLSNARPFLQGWAIVDNAGDSDWENVELSLIVGRPVSFTQPLYTPYFLNRPSLPLSIAGFAEAKTYESGFQSSKQAQNKVAYKTMALAEAAAAPTMDADYALSNVDYDTPESKSAGEQFVFTLKNPVVLKHKESAMLPFVQSNLKARKVSIFTHIPQGVSVNPSLGAELTNDLGLKLPAGPIAVYEGGTFAGDALIEFFGENEKRFISYGDDLAVKGTVAYSSKSRFDSVKISKGVMTITEKMVYEKVYTLKNSDKKSRDIILEHPFTADANLITPAKYAEKTSSAYRFEFTLPPNRELKYSVKEERPIQNTILIAQMDYTVIAAFSTNKDFPSSVKNVLKEAAKLMNTVTAEKGKLSNAQNALAESISEQGRIRQNITAVGNGSPQGQEYIKRLTALDVEIDKINADMDKIEKSLQKAHKAFDDYVANLDI
ncbi:MAG: DUF4139 domain-containing protein [Campylobacteraceae bacterium]|jgi:hypothetical protein|nr:DUF4139 domain-containing protein [Campylobacteraceae bacterium]